MFQTLRHPGRAPARRRRRHPCLLHAYWSKHNHRTGDCVCVLRACACACFVLFACACCVCELTHALQPPTRPPHREASLSSTTPTAAWPSRQKRANRASSTDASAHRLVTLLLLLQRVTHDTVVTRAAAASPPHHHACCRYIMEEAIRGDFAFVKAWKGDTAGNLVFKVRP